MMGAAQRDAMLIHEATQGLGTNNSALIGIICTRTPSQIYEIKQAYHSMYHQALEHEIDGDTSGDYRKVSGMILARVVIKQVQAVVILA